MSGLLCFILSRISPKHFERSRCWLQHQVPVHVCLFLLTISCLYEKTIGIGSHLVVWYMYGTYQQYDVVPYSTEQLCSLSESEHLPVHPEKKGDRCSRRLLHPYPYPYPYAKTRTTAGHATPERSSKCRCSSLPLRPCSCRTVKAGFVSTDPLPRCPPSSVEMKPIQAHVII